jgi:hypothetical protein
MSLRKQRFLMGTLILLSGALLFAGGWSYASSSGRAIKDLQSEAAGDELKRLNQQLRVEDIQTTNRTLAFSIVGFQKGIDGQNFTLTLQNDYNKRITAYKFLLGSKEIQADYALAENEEGVSPKEQISHQLTIDASLDRNRQLLQLDPALKTKGLSILAVRFDDGTSDGDPVAIEQLAQYRFGGKEQVENTVAALEKLRELSESDQSAELIRLKSRLRLPSNVNGLELSYSRFGLIDTTTALLTQVREVEKDSSQKRRQRLDTCIGKLRRVLSTSMKQ